MAAGADAGQSRSSMFAVPLFMDGRMVGRLEAIGDGRNVHIGQTLQLLIERARISTHRSSD